MEKTINKIPNVPIPLKLLSELTGKSLGVLRNWTQARTVRYRSRRTGELTVRTYPPSMAVVRMGRTVLVEPSEVARLAAAGRIRI